MAELARALTAEARDLDFCRSLIRRSDTAFYAVSLLLPRRVRDPATALWAFGRVVRDATDRPGAGSGAVRELDERLRRAMDGDPTEHPVDRAFARAARAHRVPRELFEAMLEGCAWDLAGRRYATYDALLAYCVRTGGAAAACMSVLMERRDPTAIARACDLGVALRMTDVARDVGEDARRGRLHLPLEWLEEARVDVDRFFIHPSPTRGVRDAVMRLMRSADPVYARAAAATGALPADCRAAVRASSRIHAALGDEMRKAGWDTVSRRVALRPLEIARIAAGALRAGPEERSPDDGTPPLREARPLIDAVARGQAPS